MDFKVLAVGDVVGAPGMDRVARSLRQLKRKTGADFVVVNGENASVVGITPDQAEEILDAGADVVTLGNHSFGKREIVDYLEDTTRILRPANLAPQAPGRGWGVYETRAGDVAVIDLIGRCNMDYTPDNPFLLVEKLLKTIEARWVFVEFHAEATSEKLAMGYHLNGRAAAVWGTHTHVPTADIRILSGGTGYITDLGMTGGQDSVLGVRWEQSLNMFRGNLTERFQPSDRDVRLQGAVFTIGADGRCAEAARVDFC